MITPARLSVLCTIATLLVCAWSPVAAQTRRFGSSPADTSFRRPDTTDTARVRRGDRPAEQQELKVVRRDYKYRRQVGLAVFMMVFVAVALTTTDAFNPD